MVLQKNRIWCWGDIIAIKYLSGEFYYLNHNYPVSDIIYTDVAFSFHYSHLHLYFYHTIDREYEPWRSVSLFLSITAIWRLRPKLKLKLFWTGLTLLFRSRLITSSMFIHISCASCILMPWYRNLSHSIENMHTMDHFIALEASLPKMAWRSKWH